MGKQLFTKEVYDNLDIQDEHDRKFIRKSLEQEVTSQRVSRLLETPCWIWTRTQKIRIGSQDYIPHHLAYELYIGTRPSGKNINRVCKNPRCINPEHFAISWAGHLTTDAWEKALEQECDKFARRLSYRLDIPDKRALSLLRVFRKKLTQLMGILPEPE